MQRHKSTEGVKLLMLGVDCLFFRRRRHPVHGERDQNNADHAANPAGDRKQQAKALRFEQEHRDFQRRPSAAV